MIKLHSAILSSVVISGALMIFTVSLISPNATVLAEAQVTAIATTQENMQDIAKSNHPVFIDYLPASSEQPEVQVTIVQENTSLDGCTLSPIYPDTIQQWCSLMNQAASEHGLDINLIAAVMLQESGGNPQAYSKSGAVGLLQVMPKDGIAASFMCINGPCFTNRPTMDELFDPDFNIQFGVRMLAGLLARHGNLRDALKAYGPMDMGYHYSDKVLSIYNNYQ